MSAAPKPISEGSLSAAPFAHVLLSATSKSLDGTLAVWPEDGRPGQDRILFNKGKPVAGRFLDSVPTLERGILGLFSRERAPYAFYEVDLVTGKTNTVVGKPDPMVLIAMGLRANVRPDAANEVIRRLGDKTQRIKKGAPIARLRLQPKENAFIELIRAAPAPPSELIESYGDPAIARRMVYLLGITNCLEPYDKAQQGKVTTQMAATRTSLSGASRVPRPDPSGSHATTLASARASRIPSPVNIRITSSRPPEPERTSKAPRSSLSGEIVAPRNEPPAPPPTLPAPLRKRWSEISRFTAMLDRQNYFEMLGVKEASSPEEIRDRYLLLAKEWHPDKLPPELDPVRPWADEAFHLITLARDTLSDPSKRTEYINAMVHGGGTPAADRKLNALVDAAMAYQKVDVLVKRREWDEALSIVEANMRIAPKEADYPAMKAWILLNKHGVDDETHRADIDMYVRKALSLNPEHLHAHFVKANVYKRKGNHEKALIHFRKVAKLDPKNLEAVREVRVANMRLSRGRSSAPPPSHRGAGIFGKLFTGKKK